MLDRVREAVRIGRTVFIHGQRVEVVGGSQIREPRRTAAPEQHLCELEVKVCIMRDQQHRAALDHVSETLGSLHGADALVLQHFVGNVCQLHDLLRELFARFQLNEVVHRVGHIR